MLCQYADSFAGLILCRKFAGKPSKHCKDHKGAAQHMCRTVCSATEREREHTGRGWRIAEQMCQTINMQSAVQSPPRIT